MALIAFWVLAFVVCDRWLIPHVARKTWTTKSLAAQVDRDEFVKRWPARKFLEIRELDAVTLTSQQWREITDDYVAYSQRNFRIIFAAGASLCLVAAILGGHIRI